jgi:hypothetical protein
VNSLPLVYRAKNKAVASLMFVFGAVLLLVNVLLVQQNKKLKDLASRPDLALEVKPGTSLPPLDGFDSNGNRHSIDYGRDSRKTALLVLSPRCRACEESLPNVEAIINGIDRRSFRLAAVSLHSEGFKEYTSRRGLNQIPILTEVDPKLRVAYNLALTPQIILIDAGGKVEKVWTGVLRGEDRQDVEMALNVRLP